ncbi:MAG: chromate transporter [Leptospirales bacterium]
MEITKLNIFLAFLKIGSYSFGAATGEVLIENLVERKKWMSLEKLREAYAVAAFAPGPYHVNIVVNLGYQLRGISGMLLSVAGFVLPSLFIAAGIAAMLYQPGVAAFFMENHGILMGLQAGIAGLLLNATIKLGEDIITGKTETAILLFLLFVMGAGKLFSDGVSFFVIILAGAVITYAIPVVRKIRGHSEP